MEAIFKIETNLFGTKLLVNKIVFICAAISNVMFKLLKYPNNYSFQKC